MPKQRSIEDRIVEKETELLRLKTLKKIDELQGQMPNLRKQRRRPR